MHQEGEMIVGLSIPFMILIKYNAMGSTKRVHTIHIYKLFVVRKIVFLGNDSEKLFGRLRRLLYLKYLMIVI